MKRMKTLSHVALSIAAVAGITFGLMPIGLKAAQAFYTQADKANPITPITAITTASGNFAPRIITESISATTTNSMYYARVTAVDKNANDTLTMQFGALPGKISVAWCNQFVDQDLKYITCEIAGNAPATPGAYPIKAEVKDNRGASNGKIFTLNVQAATQLKK